MNTKKLIVIALTLILVFSLASCNNGGSKSNNDEIQDTPGIGAEPVTAPDEENGAEDEKDVEEEIIEDAFDDPPFMRLLKSGVYYYDYQDVHFLTGPSSHNGYIVRINDKECTYTTSQFSDGSQLAYRQLLDAAAGEEYMVRDQEKYYWINDIPDLTLIDYNDCKVTETGAEQYLEETLDYIDYLDENYNPDKDPLQMFTMTCVKPTGIRVYLKNGDVYAYRFYEFGIIQNLGKYVSNPSDDPPPDCFNIPEDYRLDEGKHFGGR